MKRGTLRHDEQWARDYAQRQRTRWEYIASATPTHHPQPILTTSADAIYPLVGLCKAAGLPEPLPEFVFHPKRKWRFDYAFITTRLAVEIEGGIWSQGRHVRGAGMLADMRKYSAAALLGWRILYYQPSELLEAIADLKIEFAKP